MSSIEAAKRSKGETPNIEVCLDRISDIEMLQQQVDDFVYRSPMSENTPWVDKIVVVPPEKAVAITQKLQSVPPYNLPGTQVPPSKIFVIYNEEVLAESTAFIGNHLSFLNAMDGLGVPEGSKIKNKYEGVKANRVDIAAIEGEIEGLKAEAKLDSTPSRRKSTIASQIERLEVNLESLLSRNETVETALFTEIDALKARGMVGPEAQSIAQNLFYVAQHLARMEGESLVTTQVVSIQLLRAMPQLPQELQTMAQRAIGDVLVELGQPVAAAQNASISVQLQDGGLSVSVSGLQTVDPMVVQQKLTAKLTGIKDRVMSAPAAASTGASIAKFEFKFFSEMANALGASSGNTFSSALTFAVPAAIPGSASGGFSVGAGTQPQPAAGGYGTTPQPGAGGYGTQPQPGAGGYGTQPQPGAGGYGTQPQPGAGGFGTQPQPGAGTQPGASGTGGFGTQPQPQPGAGTTPPPPPPPTTPPPVAPPAADKCPDSVCAGKITNTGIGQVTLGMKGVQAAQVIGKRIAPKVDADHKKPTANVNGIYVSFCNGSVCRMEATVAPPTTPEGLGVGSKLQKVAKAYGQSRCKPIDSKRFGVEFERFPGVFWISDRLDCEGIEDLDFWDRPCKGNVTAIIVTK